MNAFNLPSAALAALLFVSQLSFAQQSGINSNRALLFSKYSTLSLRIDAPFAELFKHKTEHEKTWVDGGIIVDQLVVPVRIRVRGRSSLTGCNFPKLMIKIRKRDARGTLFEGAEKLDLATHCDPVEGQEVFAAMKFNHREALLYKWLQILGIPGMSSRPATVTYSDSAMPTAPVITEQAFLLEHFSSVLKRAQAVEIRHYADPRSTLADDVDDSDSIKYIYHDLPDHPQIDRSQLARIELFENMIGNFDWRLNENEIWNLKVLELPSGSWFAIPHDFNFALLAMGTALESTFPTPEFDKLSVAKRLSLIEEFITMETELRQSIELLAGDGAAQIVFLKALDFSMADLDRIKKSLLLQTK